MAASTSPAPTDMYVATSDLEEGNVEAEREARQSIAEQSEGTIEKRVSFGEEGAEVVERKGVV